MGGAPVKPCADPTTMTSASTPTAFLKPAEPCDSPTSSGGGASGSTGGAPTLRTVSNPSSNLKVMMDVQLVGGGNCACGPFISSPFHKKSPTPPEDTPEEEPSHTLSHALTGANVVVGQRTLPPADSSSAASPASSPPPPSLRAYPVPPSPYPPILSAHSRFHTDRVPRLLVEREGAVTAIDFDHHGGPSSTSKSPDAPTVLQDTESLPQASAMSPAMPPPQKRRSSFVMHDELENGGSASHNSNGNLPPLLTINTLSNSENVRTVQSPYVRPLRVRRRSVTSGGSGVLSGNPSVSIADANVINHTTNSHASGGANSSAATNTATTTASSNTNNVGFNSSLPIGSSSLVERSRLVSLAEVSHSFTHFISRLTFAWVKPVLRALALQVLSEALPACCLTTQHVHDAYLDLMGEVIGARMWGKEDMGAITATSTPDVLKSSASQGGLSLTSMADSTSSFLRLFTGVTADKATPRVNLYYLSVVSGELLHFHLQHIRQVFVAKVVAKIRGEAAVAQSSMTGSPKHHRSSSSPRESNEPSSQRRLSAAETAVALTRYLERDIAFGAFAAQDVVRPCSPGSRLVAARFSHAAAASNSIIAPAANEDVESCAAVSFELMPSIFLKFRRDFVRLQQHHRSSTTTGNGSSRDGSVSPRHSPMTQERKTVTSSAAFARTQPYFTREFISCFALGHASSALYCSVLGPEFMVGLHSFRSNPMASVISSIRATLHRLYVALTMDIITFSPFLSRDIWGRFRGPPLDLSMLYLRDSCVYFGSTVGITARLFAASTGSSPSSAGEAGNNVPLGAEGRVYTLDSDTVQRPPAPPAPSESAPSTAVSTPHSGGTSPAVAATVFTDRPSCSTSERSEKNLMVSSTNNNSSTTNSHSASKSIPVSHNSSVRHTTNITANNSLSQHGQQARTYDMPPIYGGSIDLSVVEREEGPIQLRSSHWNDAPSGDSARMNSASMTSAGVTSTDTAAPSSTPCTACRAIRHHCVVVAGDEFWEVLTPPEVSSLLCFLQLLDRAATYIPYNSNHPPHGEHPGDAWTAKVAEKQLGDVRSLLRSKESLSPEARRRLEVYYHHRVLYYTQVLPRRISSAETGLSRGSSGVKRSSSSAPFTAAAPCSSSCSSTAPAVTLTNDMDAVVPLAEAMAWWLAQEATERQLNASKPVTNVSSSASCGKALSSSGSGRSGHLDAKSPPQFSVVVLRVPLHLRTRK